MDGMHTNIMDAVLLFTVPGSWHWDFVVDSTRVIGINIL